MNDDIEIWLLFAPFWLLGTFAALGALWHFVRFVIVHGRAHAAGHVPKFSPLRRLKPHEITAEGRHHLTRATAAALALLVIAAAAVVWTLWRVW